MIRELLTYGPWLTVEGGSSYRPYFNMNSINPSTGQVRYHGTDQQLQVWDGNMWLNLQNSVVSVTTTAATNEAMDWVQRKMLEEQKLKELIERHPGLQDLQEKFELMKALCQTEEANKNAG